MCNFFQINGVTEGPCLHVLIKNAEDLSCKAILKSQMPLKVQLPLRTIGLEMYQLGVRIKAKNVKTMLLYAKVFCQTFCCFQNCLFLFFKSKWKSSFPALDHWTSRRRRILRKSSQRFDFCRKICIFTALEMNKLASSSFVVTHKRILLTEYHKTCCNAILIMQRE